MPTVAQLDRLNALVEKLTPLTKIQRGELIRAQDWNDVVGTLLEVTRAVLADDPVPQTVPPHEHPDQVKTSWLDPSLRAVVEGGGLSDPAQDARLGDLERRAGRLSDLLEKAQSDNAEVRNRVSEISTRDLTRQADITSVRRVVEGINARADDIQTLRATLASVQKDVQTAVSVGSRLQINGQPVDFGVIDQRIRSVEQLRDRLTTPAGDLLDAAQLEGRLTALTNTLVTQQQLDDALKTRQVNVSPDVLNGLRDSITTDVRGGMESLIATRFGDFTTQTNATLGQIDAKVSRAVADALPGLTQATQAAIRPEISSTVQTAIASAITASDKRVADAVAGVRTDLQAGLTDVRAKMSSEVSAQVTSQLGAQLNPIRADVASLKDQTGALGTRLTAQETGLSTVSTRVEQVARDGAAARADLQRSLITEMSSRDDAVTASVNSKVADLSRTNQDQIQSAVNALQRTLNDQIQRAAADAAAAEARNLLTTLRGEMVSVAQDQITAVQSSLQTLVNSAVTDAMKAVPGIVSQQVRLATANLPDLVKSEFTSFQPQLKQLVQQEVSANPFIRSGSNIPISGGGLVHP